jgi:putative SbcD/Mre11-related phosphoesterase
MNPNTPRTGIIEHQGWLLTPEGAAVDTGTGTAVIADVHLGYEWARTAAGDSLPAHSLTQTTAQLSRLLARVSIRKLIVAGDLVESNRPCEYTQADLEQLLGWLADRRVELVLTAGNHDQKLSRRGVLDALGLMLQTTYEHQGWTIAHGHQPFNAQRSISGHEHPCLKFEGFSAPCFLTSPTAIILPAFSTDVAGKNVARAQRPQAWTLPGWRCLASSGDELLDLGDLDRLRHPRSTYPARKPYRKSSRSSLD